MRELRIPARDKTNLAATALPGAQPLKRQALIVNSAGGELRQAYAPFAAYMAEQGFPVLTYDYRGIGGSRPDRLKGYGARLRDWGEADFAGMMDWAGIAFEGLDLVAVGHGIGGMLPALADNGDRLAGIVAVSTADPALALRQTRLFGGSRPFLLARSAELLGYAPGNRFGFREPLPKQVALDWARWLRAPGALFEEEGGSAAARASKITAPILSVSFAQDPVAPRGAIEPALRRYGSRQVTYRLVDSSEIGGKPADPMTFFRREFAELLWRPLVEWITSLEPKSRPPASA